MKHSSNKKHDSTAAALALQIRHFIAGVILFNQQVADRLGVHTTDMQCMHLLELLGPLTPGQLADRTGLTTGGVTVVLDRLEKSGYARRERNPADRRSVLIYPDQAKMEKVGVHYQAINRRLGELLAVYPEKDLNTVLEFFLKMNSLRSERLPAAGEAHPKPEKKTKKEERISPSASDRR